MCRLLRPKSRIDSKADVKKRRMYAHCGLSGLLLSEKVLVSWCFQPSQPQGSTSGLRETVIKRYIVERTNTAEISPEEQSEKAASCPENLWNEIQVKWP